MYRKLHSAHSAQLGGQLFGLRLFQLGDASYWPRPQDAASPVTTDLIVSVTEIGPDGFHQLSQGTLVLRVDLCEGYVVHVFLWTRRPRRALPLMTQ